jgi:hypothetical protein
MAVISGKLARIRFTAAVPTSSTNQACTLSSNAGATTGGTNLQITATGRRRWAVESTNIAVYGGASSGHLYSSTEYEVDHGLGRVRFKVAQATAPTKAYTVDVPWLATSFLTLAKSWSLNVNQEMLDVTSFATASSAAAAPQFRTFVPGLTDASVSVSRFFNSSSTGPVFIDRALLQSPFYLELILNSTDQAGFVCYGHVQTDQFNADVASLMAEEVTFKPTGPVYFTT